MSKITKISNTSACIVSNWSNWSDWGNWTRTRTKTRSNNNSEDCTETEKITLETETQTQTNCVIKYDNWSECDATCNGTNPSTLGKMTRLYEITPETNGGKPCDPLEISQLCIKQDCKVDCSGNWGKWSDCSAKTGTQTRTFDISINPLNDGRACPIPESETIQCPVDCKHEYNNWGLCDATCDNSDDSGYGYGNMSRELVNTIPEINGGKACAPPILSQTCSITNCPVDCYGKWGNWSDCNANTGQKTRMFDISINPLNNGIICPIPETQNCTIPITNIPVNILSGNIKNSTDKYMIFKTGTTTFNVQSGGVICDILMIGGGGSGGTYGGGGAGACIVAIGHTLPGGKCIVTVGAGGDGMWSGKNGSDSLIFVNGKTYYTAIGGGRGGSITSNVATNGIGADGGCGGGAGIGNGNIRSGGLASGSTGTSQMHTNIVKSTEKTGPTIKPDYVVLGNKGGGQQDNTYNNSTYSCPGGGGIGAEGENHNNNVLVAGRGGNGINGAIINGIQYNFKRYFAPDTTFGDVSGNNNYPGYIGGGGSGVAYANSFQSDGGFGGGGRGAANFMNRKIIATSGVANTGSGGGGGGGSGGSGIVIIRYRS
jgi:hypothetical protein